jgi:hypothetical protein
MKACALQIGQARRVQAKQGVPSPSSHAQNAKKRAAQKRLKKSNREKTERLESPLRLSTKSNADKVSRRKEKINAQKSGHLLHTLESLRDS